MSIPDTIASYLFVPIVVIILNCKLDYDSYVEKLQITTVFIVLLKILLWDFDIYNLQFVYFFLLLFSIQVFFEYIKKKKKR